MAAAPPRRQRLLGLAALAALALAAAAGWAADHWLGSRAANRPVHFLNITFREQAIYNARFAPESNAIVYSAALQGTEPQIYVRHPDYPKPQPLGPPDTNLLSVAGGQVAVLTGAKLKSHRWFEGTLAEMPLNGGAPRLLLQHVFDADWSPGARDLAVLHFADGHLRLEYPIGHVLVQTTVGYLSDVRVSPDGNRVAFFRHPVDGDNRGTVEVVDRAGRLAAVTGSFPSLEGLAWSSDGDALWFGAANRLERVSARGGTPQTMLSSPANLELLDFSREGAVLANDDALGVTLLASRNGAAEEDLTWFQVSLEPAFAADGRSLIFTDSSPESGADYTILYQRLDGSPAVPIGPGDGLALSPNGAWAIGMLHGPPPHLVAYPTGPGQPRPLDPGELTSIGSVSFFPDSEHFLVCGQAPGHRRCYRQAVSGGAPVAATPEGTSDARVSPDGRTILALSLHGASPYALLSVAGSPPPRPVPQLTAADTPVQWTADGRGIIFQRGDLPAHELVLDLASGSISKLRDLAPANPAGAQGVRFPAFAPDLKSYAYSYTYRRGILTVIEGLPK